jgi:hypothetical protein
MDRSEARKRIDRVIESMNAMYVDRRCPKCDAIGQIGGPTPTPDVPLSAEDQRLLQEQPLHEFQLDHREGCSMTADVADAVNLAVRFKYFPIKPAVVQTERGPRHYVRLVTDETSD